MIDKVNFNIKETTIENLLKFHKPEIINTYCSKCPKYSAVWTCPPLPFDENKYLSEYKYCYVISGKVFIADLSEEEKAELINHTFSKYDDITVSENSFSKIFNGIYYAFREETDNIMVELEGHFQNSRVLTSGRCLICKKCSRASGKPCIFPEKLRYSLESLGFDVMAVTEDILGEKIEWSNDKMPKYVTGVSALLTKEPVSKEAILSILSSNKN